MRQRIIFKRKRKLHIPTINVRKQDLESGILPAQLRIELKKLTTKKFYD